MPQHRRLDSRTTIRILRVHTHAGSYGKRDAHFLRAIESIVEATKLPAEFGTFNQFVDSGNKDPEYRSYASHLEADILKSNAISIKNSTHMVQYCSAMLVEII